MSKIYKNKLAFKVTQNTVTNILQECYIEAAINLIAEPATFKQRRM